MGAWSCILEAVRRRREGPEARLAELGLERGMKVADVGAGRGFYAFPAAEIVGDDGMVYAVEPNPRRAREISRRAEEMGAKNLKVLEAGAEDIGGIPTGTADIAMSISSFHHFADVGKALPELRRIVKPGGMIYIRDIEAGRVFRHGSDPASFRRVISAQFPRAEFEDGPGYLVATIRL